MQTDPLYQYLPPMADGDFQRLKESIARHGFLAGKEVEILPDGRILDGHHRAKACAELGIECPTRMVDVPEDERWDYVYLSNVPRRHLLVEDRTRLVREYLRRHPEQSDRAVARASGLSPTTVGRIREKADLPPSPDAVARAHTQSRRVSTVDTRDTAAITSDDDEGEEDTPAENYADHRNQVWVDVVIGFPCPSDEERKRQGTVPYPQASARDEWRSGRLFVTTPVPESAIEMRQLCNDIGFRLFEELRHRPLRTVLRKEGLTS
jgi:hypothetical protein